MNCSHRTVCHERNFVDKETGVHTNSVEGMWSRTKPKVKVMHGTSRGLILEYMAEFMYKMAFRDNTLAHFWQHVSEFCPLNVLEGVSLESSSSEAWTKFVICWKGPFQGQNTKNIYLRIVIFLSFRFGIFWALMPINVILALEGVFWPKKPKLASKLQNLAQKAL